MYIIKGRPYKEIIPKIEQTARCCATVEAWGNVGMETMSSAIPTYTHVVIPKTKTMTERNNNFPTNKIEIRLVSSQAPSVHTTVSLSLSLSPSPSLCFYVSLSFRNRSFAI